MINFLKKRTRSRKERELDTYEVYSKIIEPNGQVA